MIFADWVGGYDGGSCVLVVGCTAIGERDYGGYEVGCGNTAGLLL